MRLSVLAVVAGAALVFAALWLAWPPLSLLVSGAALVAWGLLRSTDAAA